MANPALRPRFLAPGDKLGKFDLIRQIAVGGMAELYLARTMGIEGFEKLVVVKRILPQYVDNPSFVNMFLNEARLSATLHHPNITQVYDIGVEEGDYFFSMEYVHGEDLARLSVTAQENGVPLSLDCALTLVAGLCAGLHYAHEKAGTDGKPLNVVHRDVSPSNVLVSYDGAVKLVDFGIAKAGSQPAVTRGGLKGKIAYMSPEQCKGKGVLDRRSDVFSIGSILYELTTGQLPFTDETEYGVLSQIVNTDAPPPSKVVPGYPPALEAIVMKALARDLDQRYKSALELQGQIEDFAHENRLRVSPLVLARLMSTLFPARLEEWDHARAQGAFFVEQHVLRTLIESGKTGDHTSLAAPPARPAPAPAPPPAPPPEDEATDVFTVHAVGSPAVEASGPISAPPAPEAPGDRTLAGPPVIEATTPSRSPTPVPMRPTPVPRPTPVAAPVSLERTLAPVPGVPGAVPVVAAGPALVPVPSMAAGAGTLISNRSPSDGAPVQITSAATDVTERVRVPTPLPERDDTAFVRPPRSRLPLILGLGLCVAVAGVAMVVLGGGGKGDEREKAAAESKATQPAPPPDQAEDKAAGLAPEPVEKAPAAKVEPEPVTPEPEITPPEPVRVEPSKVEPPKVEPPKVEPLKIAPPKPEPVKVEPPQVEKKKPAIVKPPAVAKTPAVVKPPAVAKTPPVKKPPPKKLESKSEPKKEPAWNDESPFMPVRTEKK